MRESFSGTALFMIVVFFVILFTGYLCLSINQTRAFNVKNAIIRIVERYGIGVKNVRDLADNPEFTAAIAEELENYGYRTPGSCNRRSEIDPAGVEWVGFDQAGGITSNEDAVFCIKIVMASDDEKKDITNPTRDLHYFKVKTFYHFDVPVLKIFVNLYVDGDTKAML